MLRFAPAGSVGWAVAPALLLGGLGGGLVISPNVTMTLHDVPVRMAGSAGGALQTGQRFGAAIGTATLPALFYLVLSSTGNDFRAAIAAALATAVVGVASALVIAVVEWRREVHRERADAGAAGGSAELIGWSERGVGCGRCTERRVRCITPRRAAPRCRGRRGGTPPGAGAGSPPPPPAASCA